MTDTPVPPSPKISKTKKVIWAALGTIFLGAIGSGVWEIFARPGLSKFGRLVLSIVTLGSQTVQDSAYSTAALDPTPVAPLLMVFALSFFPLFLAISSGTMWLQVRSAEKMRAARKSHGGEGPAAHSGEPPERFNTLEFRNSIWDSRKFALGMLLMMSIIFGGCVIGIFVLNQAVLIRRVFTANVAICAPYMSESEEERIWADFAAVATKAEYLPIDGKLRSIASQNGASLLGYSVW